jgi:hypothetical protein
VSLDASTVGMPVTQHPPCSPGRPVFPYPVPRSPEASAADKGQKFLGRLEKKHDTGKALSILAHKLGRAIYYMLKRQTAFDMDLFLQS